MEKPGETSRPPAMTDVAELAGVSHQTVSRVINGVGSVRPATRQRVLSAIEELGYRRNEAARSLVTRRSNLLGIITTQFVNYGPASTLLSVQMAAKDAGHYVAVAALPQFSEAQLREAINVFLGQGVAAIILIAPVREIAEEFARIDAPVPTIAISSSWLGTSDGVIRIGVDQREGARAATRYLLGQGSKSVALFAGPGSWFDAQERRDGWLDALREARVEPGPEFEGDWSASSGYKQALMLLEGPLPDAVFIANDQMALGALRAFAQAGVKVPDDIKVVGFDDESGTEFFQPSLTTVRQDFESVGKKAVQAVTDRLAGRPATDQFIMPTLILRESA